MFSGGRLYSKGKGSLFLAWVIDEYPNRVIYISNVQTWGRDWTQR
jgi:hypothetical protein